MSPLKLSQHLVTYDLESHINDLLRQKDLLQNISSHSNNNIDFGDIIETYSLLISEIERLQQQLQTTDVFEEEEEEIEAIIKKYNIREVIMEKDGSKRPVKMDDFLIKNNKGVERAFKTIANWHKQYKMLEEYKDKGEPDGFPSPNRLVLKNQELTFNNIKKHFNARCS